MGLWLNDTLATAPVVCKTEQYYIMCCEILHIRPHIHDSFTICLSGRKGHIFV